jgi:hypothetical protein
MAHPFYRRHLVCDPGMTEESAMSRVEPKERPQEKREAETNRRDLQIGHTPEKAEGDERTVDEALRNEQRRG